MSAFRLAVISDTHGDRASLARFAKQVTSIHALAHLGDGVADLRDLDLFPPVPIHTVRGNGDWFEDLPKEALERIHGFSVFMCHGHLFEVKRTLVRLSLRAREADARIVLFGHTHTPYTAWDGDRLFLNPGSLRSGSYALIDLSGERPAPTFHKVH